MYQEWRNSPVTKALLTEISRLLDQGVEYILSGTTIESHAETAAVIGKMKAYKDILEIDFEEIKGEG